MMSLLFFLQKKNFFFFFFEKFAKVWNREIFDMVALAKVNSRENVKFFGRESFFSRKIFFSPKACNYNIYTFLLVPY